MGSGREKGEVRISPFLSRIPLAADPACRPLAFSIVLTGYLELGFIYNPPTKLNHCMGLDGYVVSLVVEEASDMG